MIDKRTHKVDYSSLLLKLLAAIVSSLIRFHSIH